MPLLRLFAPLALLLTVIGCSSSTTTTTPPNPIPVTPAAPPDRYAAGEVAGGGFTQAAVWKNDTVTILGPSGQNSLAQGVAVSGSDVFVGGYVFDGASTTQALLWKNGVAQALTSRPMYGFVRGVAASGSDVYAVGQTADSANAYATIWKNGVATTLPSKGLLGRDGKVLFYSSSANAVLVQGSDVYVVGTDEVNLKTTDGSTASGGVAVLWKNGVETLLSDATYSSSATSLWLAGTDLYIAGNVLQGLGTTNPTQVAAYWKNGSLVKLSDASTNGSAILVSGSDVYVGGQTGYGTGRDKATLWKNATPTDLSAGSVLSGVYGLQVLNGDVYAVGSLSTTGANYWINGTPAVIAPPGGSGWNALTFVTH